MNTIYYIPGDTLEEDLFAEPERFIEDVDSEIDPFHIGQSHENRVAFQMQCRKCGGLEFHLGRSDFYTAIRCVKCRWEFNVHEG